MKRIVATLGIFFAFTAYAAAQEGEDRLRPQPPVVTQAQVERDEKAAKEQREKLEKERKAEEQKKAREQQIAGTSNSTIHSTKKASTRPDKQ